ncbi:hypothetical protein FOA52_012138 [Chlamydomonas sp. UWO 241]|nr:hypothetical protein FOA52_012138 [Chlamydomonas sp. UWO 241]
MQCCSIAGTKLLLFVGLLLIAAGLTLPGLLQHLLNAGIRDAIVWQPDSPAATDSRYRGSADGGGAHDFVQLFLWNVTNVEGIRNGSKPSLQQVGPYTYQKNKYKVFAQWDTNGRVATKEYAYYTLVPEMTTAQLDAPIVTLNLPLIGVVESIGSVYGPRAEKWLDYAVSVIAAWRDGHVNGLFTRRTAEEMLWGYDDPLLVRLNRFLPKGMIPSTRVSLLHNMSGPDEALAQQPVVYDTGAGDLFNIWNVLSDEGHTEATCWNGCVERVRGSDGAQFAPGVRRDSTLRVWVGQLYRSETFVFESNVNWLGVQFLRFTPDPAMLAPDECHYQRIAGLMNVTTPMAVGMSGHYGDAVGPPVYISLPHFCGCDPSLTADIDGMQCDFVRHSTHIDVEPITGISMRGHMTVQMSSALTAQAKAHLEPKIAASSNASVVIPIFWQEENIWAGESDVRGFKSRVYSVLWYKRMLECLPVVGFALAALSLLHLVRLRVANGGLDDNNVDAQPASWGIHAPLLTPFDAGAGSPFGRAAFDGGGGIVGGGDSLLPSRVIEDAGSGLSSIAVGHEALEERYRSEHRSLAPPSSPSLPAGAAAPAGGGSR